MIVLVRDIENNITDLSVVTGLLAGMTAIAKSKKTLALQLTGYTDESILNILFGNDLKLNSIRNIYSFSDDGLDSLYVRAETTALTKEHFDECATHLLNKDNMLDVLKPTGVANILETCTTEKLVEMINRAEEVYDYVYVAIPKNKDLYKALTEISSREILIVSQGKTKKVNIKNTKTDIVVKEFEPESKFDISSMKKQFGVKKLYTVPHNVAFQDAIISQTVLDFIIMNKGDGKNDSNYSFVSSIWKLLSNYMSDKNDDEDEEDIVKKKMGNKDAADYVELPESSLLKKDSVQSVKTTKRKFLFLKKEEEHLLVNMEYSGNNETNISDN